MKLQQLHRVFTQELTPFYPKEEVQSFFEILTAFYLKINRAQLFIEQHLMLDTAKVAQFTEAIERLKKQEPVQYILGETQFYGITLKVTPSTLIPRPETEELVDWIIKDFKPNKELDILDVCTGSGCIAIALGHNLQQAKIKAVDISKGALNVAQQNAERLNLNVSFYEQDALKQLPIDQNFDIIVSNPPYVRAVEKEQMSANVLDYEPAQALFVSNANPLLFYRAIGTYAFEHLTADGALYLEINEYLSKETQSLLSEIGFKHSELRQDIFGKNRMIKCWLDE